MNLSLFTARLKSLRDPVQTLNNVWQGNCSEIHGLPSVHLKSKKQNHKMNLSIPTTETSTQAETCQVKRSHAFQENLRQYFRQKK